MEARLSVSRHARPCPIYSCKLKKITAVCLHFKKRQPFVYILKITTASVHFCNMTAVCLNYRKNDSYSLAFFEDITAVYLLFEKKTYQLFVYNLDALVQAGHEARACFHVSFFLQRATLLPISLKYLESIQEN